MESLYCLSVFDFLYTFLHISIYNDKNRAFIYWHWSFMFGFNKIQRAPVQILNFFIYYNNTFKWLLRSLWALEYCLKLLPTSFVWHVRSCDHNLPPFFPNTEKIMSEKTLIISLLIFFKYVEFQYRVLKLLTEIKETVKAAFRTDTSRIVSKNLTT